MGKDKTRAVKSGSPKGLKKEHKSPARKTASPAKKKKKVFEKPGGKSKGKTKKSKKG